MVVLFIVDAHLALYIHAVVLKVNILVIFLSLLLWASSVTALTISCLGVLDFKHCL